VEKERGETEGKEMCHLLEHGGYATGKSRDEEDGRGGGDKEGDEKEEE